MRSPSRVPHLQVRNLAIRHEGADADTPAGVSFDVFPGEVVLILGPSGSGKSTLALALNGLIPHDVAAEATGSVEVDGLDAADASVAKLSTRVAMVFQDPDAQLVTGTVLDEVAFGPENLRMPAAEVLERSEAALRRVGLWERRDDNPDRLSGGGRQRLAIAAALAMGSPLLVLDEPTANLDPQGIEEVYAALADVVSAGDRAIVLVEHNLDAAVDLVDRVVVLDGDGCLVVVGDVDTVLRDRADELLALGVWLPTSALAALALRKAGYTLRPLPLTPAELRAALEAEPERAPHGTAPPHAVASDAVAEPLAVLPSHAAPAPDTVPQPERTGPSERDPLITVRGLTLRRGRTDVLHDVGLDIHSGDFVAVVGVNGAGKTSLIQSIAGVIVPPRGTVRIDGIDVSRASRESVVTRVGFVFQNPEHQFIANTVYDELAHDLRRMPKSQSRPVIERMLERFSLTGRANAHPVRLSGGQKRRLSVGTALIAGAPVLILDEPTFGQDRARADELLALLRSLNEAGTTIVVVTHDMQLVTDYADRTIVMQGGRILADAATADVFADADLIARAGLRLPPLRQALQGLSRHPSLSGVTRLSDLPGGRTS